ncbi:universal stress protein [Pelobacter seleniigenes]|uniref:universal stress protein n=1 Tax=Pelobacter seleniigenes TaxID=407188 RepID=UPI0004A6F518|nr:universal stress protein [Pelobacter seleniigenes]
MNELKQVLVVCQSTQECRKAVRFGTMMAEKFGSELSVLHTYHNVFGLEGWNLPIPKQMVEDGYQQMLDETKKKIGQMVKAAREKGIKVEVLVREGKLIDELFKLVEAEKIDLLVLPSHPEWRLEHFFFGRENEAILRKLPCSVTFVNEQ